jgi:hypothetical protein
MVLSDSSSRHAIGGQSPTPWRWSSWLLLITWRWRRR